MCVFDKNVDLYFAISGHYSLNIFRRKSRNKYGEILFLENDLSTVEKYSQIIKIHK